MINTKENNDPITASKGTKQPLVTLSRPMIDCHFIERSYQDEDATDALFGRLQASRLNCRFHCISAPITPNTTKPKVNPSTYVFIHVRPINTSTIHLLFSPPPKAPLTLPVKRLWKARTRTDARGARFGTPQQLSPVLKTSRFLDTTHYRNAFQIVICRVTNRYHSFLLGVHHLTPRTSDRIQLHPFR